MLTCKRAGAVSATSRTQRCTARSSLYLSSRVALTSWDSSRQDSSALQQQLPRGSHGTGAPGRKAVTMMGNKGAGGIFSPLVVVTRNIVGEKEFNKLRGKAISLHSQVIKEFLARFGVENKQVQGVIRLAKKNGEWLGFLA